MFVQFDNSFNFFLEREGVREREGKGKRESKFEMVNKFLRPLVAKVDKMG